MNYLTKEEIRALPWSSDEQWAVVDTTNRKSIFFGAPSEDACQRTLSDMGPKHPKYRDLLIVKKTDGD